MMKLSCSRSLLLALDAMLPLLLCTLFRLLEWLATQLFLIASIEFTCDELGDKTTSGASNSRMMDARLRPAGILLMGRCTN